MDEVDWFTALSEDRKETFKVLKKTELIDFIISHIVDTYRESAHFLLELLQNADDVGAFSARLDLRSDGIWFGHNGKIPFSVSDPSLERQQGISPGHINSITTFSLSNKKEDVENKIGKFGIGFKSVFQYTETPHIYNPPFNFKIEDYIVPNRVSENPEAFKNNETTLIWLPFNKLDQDVVQVHDEIAEKLAVMNNPLLFLRTLEEIKISYNSISKQFRRTKQKIAKVSIPNIDIYDVRLNDDRILRLDKKVAIQDKKGEIHHLPINLAFIIDKNDKITAHVDYEKYFKYAWCYFPTRQNTNLNYIINAPFILTPNREALREKSVENDQIIDELSILMESSIDILKGLGYLTEEFLSTIPIADLVPAEFKPIQKKMVAKLLNGEYMPIGNGDFITAANSYICLDKPLTTVLIHEDYNMLRKITGKPNARILLSERSSVWSDANQYTYFYKTFIQEKSELGALWFGSKIVNHMLLGTSQSFNILFFRLLKERANLILGKGQSLWNKAFVPVMDDKDVVSYVKPNDSFGQPQVMIGGPRLKGRKVIVDYLIEDTELETFLTSVLNFKIPDGFDDFLHELDIYIDDDNGITTEKISEHLSAIRVMFSEITPARKIHLIDKLKNIKFIPIVSNNGLELVNPYTDCVFYPTPELEEFFRENAEECYWLRLDGLDIGTSDAKQRQAFFKELNIEFSLFLKSDGNLCGLEGYLVDISLKKSTFLATMLCEREDLDFKLDVPLLRDIEWLFDKHGVKRLPNKIKFGELHPDYPELFSRIHINLGAVLESSKDRFADLFAEERILIELLIPAMAELSPDEIKTALAELVARKRELRQNVPLLTDGKDNDLKVNTATPQGLLDSWTKEPLNKTSNLYHENYLSSEVIPSAPTAKDFWINNYDFKENPGGFVSGTVVGMEYKRQQGDRIQKQFEKELEVDLKRNKLIELAGSFESYSFGWFKTLLELEDSFTAEDRVKRNPLRIVFNKVDIDEDMMILSDTSIIPSNIEDIGDLSIEVFSGDEKITVKGELVGVRKKSLLIRLGNNEQLKPLKANSINRAVLEASSPDFILERLKIAFSKLNFDNGDNLKSSKYLPKNLKFVFGPPGTGKTTYLSWLIGGKNTKILDFCGETILPFMERPDCRVLVLTPTNKAADVLAQRILDNFEEVNDDPLWLIRFGQTHSLEKSDHFVGDRKLNIYLQEKLTLITTIARFPYESFQLVDGDKIISSYGLKDFNWDVIIFDEASMIGQAALLYVVYYANQINPNVEIFIGGDPFQIPPIIQFEYPYWSYIPDPALDNDGHPILDENGTQLAWKQDGGNIYSFVQLMDDNSFIDPKTSPHPFKIHKLFKQYRSLQSIGKLFSHYRYGGMLDHHRNPTAISLDSNLAAIPFEVNKLPLKAINIIRFPVNKNGSVFRSRSVKGSPYHIYSAIFTVELIKYIQVNAHLSSDIYKIGIISPYALQSALISKLIDVSATGKINVTVGTVHGFQGDECNLIIVVLNPPRNITRSVRSFLNKKNILNVAISRARDKMIILTPYDPENELNLEDLHQIRYIERLTGSLDPDKNELLGYESSDIEISLWGSAQYIENITLSSPHQNVNIYADITRHYEIRHDENAVDVVVKRNHRN